MAGSGSKQFDTLKRHLDTHRDVVREVEFAFASLLVAANPSDRGLRFMFGGGAEWIMAAAAWSAGILTAPAGHNANGFDLADLLESARGMWSVKASAQEKSSPIRLTNFMGDGKGATWSDPTLFVGPYLGGAVFIDPTLEPDVRARTKRASDALVLSAKVVSDFADSHPENCIAFDVAINDGRAQGDRYAFIKSILAPAHFPHLSKPFTAATPVESSTLVDEIKRLTDLKEEGKLDDTQFNAAVQALLVR